MPAMWTGKITVTPDDLDDDTYEAILRAFQEATLKKVPFAAEPDDFLYDDWIIECAVEQTVARDLTPPEMPSKKRLIGLMAFLAMNVREDVPTERMTSHLISALEEVEAEVRKALSRDDFMTASEEE